MNNYWKKVAHIYFLHLRADDKRSGVHFFCTIDVGLLKMLKHIKQTTEEFMLSYTVSYMISYKAEIYIFFLCYHFFCKNCTFLLHIFVRFTLFGTPELKAQISFFDSMCFII